MNKQENVIQMHGHERRHHDYDYEDRNEEEAA